MCLPAAQWLSVCMSLTTVTNHMNIIGSHPWLRRSAVAVLAVVLVTAHAFAAQAGPPKAQPGNPLVGDLAPDFTLPTFTSLLSATNPAAAVATNFTLSVARQTQPVALIFSSYT
jgi:hypothetical protein